MTNPPQKLEKDVMKMSNDKTKLKTEVERLSRGTNDKDKKIDSLQRVTNIASLSLTITIVVHSGIIQVVQIL